MKSSGVGAARDLIGVEVGVGTLFYGASRFEATFDDRVLAHLQIVMTAKLRRNEAFILSWTEPTSAGSGRSMIWISPHTDLHFKFSGSKPPVINPQWLDELAATANTAHGLHVVEENTTGGGGDDTRNGKKPARPAERSGTR